LLFIILNLHRPGSRKIGRAPAARARPLSIAHRAPVVQPKNPLRAGSSVEKPTARWLLRRPPALVEFHRGAVGDLNSTGGRWAIEKRRVSKCILSLIM